MFHLLMDKVFLLTYRNFWTTKPFQLLFTSPDPHPLLHVRGEQGAAMVPGQWPDRRSPHRRHQLVWGGGGGAVCCKFLIRERALYNFVRVFPRFFWDFYCFLIRTPFHGWRRVIWRSTWQCVWWEGGGGVRTVLLIRIGFTYFWDRFWCFCFGIGGRSLSRRGIMSACTGHAQIRRWRSMHPSGASSGEQAAAGRALMWATRAGES